MVSDARFERAAFGSEGNPSWLSNLLNLLEMIELPRHLIGSLLDDFAHFCIDFTMSPTQNPSQIFITKSSYPA